MKIRRLHAHSQFWGLDFRYSILGLFIICVIAVSYPAQFIYDESQIRTIFLRKHIRTSYAAGMRAALAAQESIPSSCWLSRCAETATWFLLVTGQFVCTPDFTDVPCGRRSVGNLRNYLRERAHATHCYAWQISHVWLFFPICIEKIRSSSVSLPIMLFTFSCACCSYISRCQL